MDDFADVSIYLTLHADEEVHKFRFTELSWTAAWSALLHSDIQQPQILPATQSGLHRYRLRECFMLIRDNAAV